jgi:hypothetical protein
MIFATGVLASDVDVAVVDVTAPTGSVTLQQGSDGTITINMSVTGKQEGTATFEVNRNWTLSGGTFIGSSPKEFTVPARAAQDPATTFSTTGTVSVAADQAAGTFTLAVGAIDITNSNSTGAKLAAGASSSYSITVELAPSTNTPPVVAVTGVTDGASYVKGSVPAAGCSVTDSEDGPSTFAATLSAITGPYAADGIGSQTAQCSYTDAGGLTASASVTYSIYDATPPVIDYILNPTSPDGNNGWYKSAVTLTWTITEIESPLSLLKTGCVDQNITTDQLETTYSCEVTSAGGSAGPISVTIKKDATKPLVSLVGGPADGGSYYFGFVPSAPTCDASDATSGLDGSCSVSGYGTTVGTHTVTATAKDMAGNTNSASATYKVLAWTLKGFYQPVDMNGVWNVVKGGQTVPLKFNVYAGTTELKDVSVIKPFAYKEVSCTSAGAVTDDIEITTTGGTSLRYDSVAGQFIQNWQTPKKSGVCYQVTMYTDDGSSLSALFKLK